MLDIYLKNIRPLTHYMKELLAECYRREIMNLEPCDVANIKHVKGLIERGLLDTKFFITEKGKKILALYITDLGRVYLSKL